MCCLPCVWYGLAVFLDISCWILAVAISTIFFVVIVLPFILVFIIIHTVYVLIILYFTSCVT